MKSALGKLNSRDFVKGAIVAVAVALLSTLQSVLNKKGLDLTMADLQNLATVSVTAMVGYLLKNLASDEEDKIGGVL
jgi:hypothetical protein